jgi:FeoB-associated Cys-rich membrane protein
MTWQLIAVLVIVAAAAVYLIRQTWRTWSRKAGACGGGCGCARKTPTATGSNGTAALIPSEQLTLRRRTPGQS